jgi:hypothetical protein
MYTSREEGRDVFLGLLRKFQDLKTKIDVSSFRYFKDELRRDGTTLIQSQASSNNAVWFVDFFVTMLLQVGVGGEKETDSEVLSILTSASSSTSAASSANSEKVHKLHRRFSEPAANANSELKKRTVAGASAQSTASSLLGRIENCFRGNLEFFYLFINLSDSYTFNQLLGVRLANELSVSAGANLNRNTVEKVSIWRARVHKRELLPSSPFHRGPCPFRRGLPSRPSR